MRSSHFKYVMRKCCSHLKQLWSLKMFVAQNSTCSDLHVPTVTAVAMEDLMVVISKNNVSIYRPRLPETEVLLFSALIQRD